MSQTLLRSGFIAFGFGVACGGTASPVSGVSPEASTIVNSLENYLRHQQSSEALYGVKARLITELNILVAECAEDDWDGFGAEAISEAAVLQAETFIRSLPENIPAPELSAEPDGEISFDWQPSRTKTFSLSVSAGDRVAYAWIDGANRGHTAELFDGQTFPVRALEELQRILGHGAALRTA